MDVSHSIGKDWRTVTSISVISSAHLAHFVTVAIFASQKLVFIVDGAAGVHDHSDLLIPVG